jgi:predicted phage tail protein
MNQTTNQIMNKLTKTLAWTYRWHIVSFFAGAAAALVFQGLMRTLLTALFFVALVGGAYWAWAYFEKSKKA